MAILKYGRKFILILTELGFIMVTGILKHFLIGIPADAMITGSVTAVGLYFGVNWAQKKVEAINVQKDNCQPE